MDTFRPHSTPLRIQEMMPVQICSELWPSEMSLTPQQRRIAACHRQMGTIDQYIYIYTDININIVQLIFSMFYTYVRPYLGFCYPNWITYILHTCMHMHWYFYIYSHMYTVHRVLAYMLHCFHLGAAKPQTAAGGSHALSGLTFCWGNGLGGDFERAVTRWGFPVFDSVGANI